MKHSATWLIGLLCGCFTIGQAQRLEPIPFGDFQQWMVREIKESPLLGGKTRTVYAIASNDTVRGVIPYHKGASPWGTSNVLAIVAGVTKVSGTVSPVERAPGNRCARMASQYETVKVLGLVNITVLISGSIFLGETIEPIRSVNNPYAKIDMGIPFTQKPKALVYDYRAKISETGVIHKATGFSSDQWKGTDCAQAFIYLQNRVEHPDGSITATRVGTAYEHICQSSNGWIIGHRLPVHYGDIVKKPFYQPYMELTTCLNAKNSKGEMVPVKETGWGSENTPVTHMVLMLCAGSQGAFVGALGNEFDVDNFKLEY